MDAIAAAGSVLAQLGVPALAFGGVLFLIAAHRWSLAKVLETTPIVSCADLTAGDEPPRRVIVTGHLRSGPSRTLLAPISGAECVWFRVLVRTNPERRGPHTRHQWDSDDQFTVGDGTGEVQVSARLVDRHLHEEDLGHGLAADLLEWTMLPDGRHRETIASLKRAGMRLRTRRWGDYYGISEFHLPPGRAITVLGRPRRHGRTTILTTGGVICGVSDRTVDRLRAGARAVVADTRSLPRILLAGGAVLLVVGQLLQVPRWLTG